MNKIIVPILILACALVGCKKDETTATNTPATPTTPVATPSVSPSADPTPSATPSESPSSNPGATNTQVVGTWKIDMAKTTLTMDTEKDKQDAEAGRLEIKADGTYATNGGDHPQSGKWTVTGDEITLKSNNSSDRVLPPFKIAPDGSSLVLTVKNETGDKTALMVMIKA